MELGDMQRQLVEFGTFFLRHDLVVVLFHGSYMAYGELHLRSKRVQFQRQLMMCCPLICREQLESMRYVLCRAVEGGDLPCLFGSAQVEFGKIWPPFDISLIYQIGHIED